MSILIKFTWSLVFAMVFANQTLAKSPHEQDILSFIRELEANGNYAAIHHAIPNAKRPDRPVNQMTVGEVLSWQGSLTGVKSTAAGAYQFIHKTLKKLVNENDIPKTRVFDQSLQDQLARILMKACAPHLRAEQISKNYADCLAKIWAALPVTQGPKKGQSAYEGIAGNTALASVETYLDVLQGTKIDRASASAPLLQAAPEGPNIIIVQNRVAKINSALIKLGGNKSIHQFNFDPYALE